MGLIN
jgi:hypothetical protein